MDMPGRQFSSTNDYRYGFNGKEKDNKDGVVQYDYGFRIYDPRLVRFKSTDPLQADFPELTPYQYASNSPISGIDLDGAEFQYYNVKYVIENGQTKLQVGDFMKTVDRTVRVSATLKITHYVAGLFPVSAEQKVSVDVNYSDVGLSPTVVPANGVWRVLPHGVNPNDLPALDDPIWETFETPDEFGTRIVNTGNQIIQAIDDISSIYNVAKLLKGSVASRKLGVKEGNTRDKYVNNTKGWKTGDPVNNLTSKGKTPSWSTIRSRHWKNRALNAADGEFSESNLKRMQKGKAPKLFDPGTGKTESVELHHPKGRGDGNLFEFEELLPSQHAAKDPNRKLKKE